MEKNIKMYSPSQITTYIDTNLKILMNIDVIKYALPITSLFGMAARENPKREFLFVSKVLGKHIPINPHTLKIIGGLLARSWLEENEQLYLDNTPTLVQALMELQAGNPSKDPNQDSYLSNALELLSEPIALKEKTLFIGFAETATGIAQAVFNCFSNASYIHTTRENLETLKPSFVFLEEHSHAMNHSLFSLDEDFLMGFDRIVLVDDELTTGNTSLNLIKNLPGSSFGIITILDWRSAEQVEKFESLKELEVKVSSLLKGTISCIKEGAIMPQDEVLEITYENAKPITHSEVIINRTDLIDGYLTATGRFGIIHDQNEAINNEITAVADMLLEKRLAGNCLCLGTEEFIYLPCMIAAKLGSGVYFHSTTRSPIYSRTRADYCIKNKIKFPRPLENTTMNYLYNIEKGFYSQVFLFTEKPLKECSKLIFRKIFGAFEIKEVVFISWDSVNGRNCD